MTGAETAALVQALRVDPGLVVHVMKVPDDTPTPYVVVRPGGGRDIQERLTGDYAAHRPWWSVMAVGEDADECAWAVEHVDAALRPRGIGVVPQVPGRSCHSITRDVLHEMDIDEDTNPKLLYQVAEYGYRSAPAA